MLATLKNVDGVDEFIAQWRPYLNQIARSWYPGHHEDAEDLVQEVCMRVGVAYNRYIVGEHGDESTKSWLSTIMRHVVINQWRKSKRRPLLTTHETVLEEYPSAGDDLDAIEGPTPEFANAWRHIPERMRRVLWLVEVDGLHYEEVAALLGLPLGTVMSRKYRAQIYFRKHYRP